MAWKSETGQFNDNEIGTIELMGFQELLGTTLNSDPVVALRALAELLLHDDIPRLLLLLQNDHLTDHWGKYLSDKFLDGKEDEYARQLRMLSGKPS